MKTLKRIIETEYDTEAEIFDAGTRKVIVKFCAKGVRVRASRQAGWRFVSWQKLYDVGTFLAADFDAGPRSGTRVTRGRVG